MSTVHELPQPLRERASKILALVMDVDGVLSDGRIIYDEFGDELKCFNVQDGAGLVYWRRVGLRSGIITARKAKLIKRRAKEMQVDYLAQGAPSKLEAYHTFLKRFRLGHEHVCAIGDDMMDLPMLRRVGFAVSVPNGVEEVKSACHYVTTRAGGHGAVREVIDLILKAKGLWDEAVKPYYK